MLSVSMSIAELKKALLAVSATTVFIGLSAGFLRYFFLGGSLVQALILGLLSGATWAVAILVWALRRPWTKEWLARLTGRPIIHGVWFGHLYSNYGTDDDLANNKIPIAFVIKQTFLSYSLLSYTEKRDSKTLVESLTLDDKHDIFHLRYMYEFEIRKPGELKLATGAAELKLIETGTRLRGHYLTNSPTKGHVDLSLVCREPLGVDTFLAARNLYEAKHPD